MAKETVDLFSYRPDDTSFKEEEETVDLFSYRPDDTSFKEEEETVDLFSLGGVAPEEKQVVTVEKKQPDWTMDNLYQNKDWLTDARTIYEYEKGEKFKGSDKELDYWFRNRHSRFGHDLTDLGLTASDTGNMSDDVKAAWVNSLDTWENTENSVGSFFNALYQMGTDPTTIASMLAGFGIGGLAKLGGQRGAMLAAKFTFKDQLKKSLADKVGEKAAKDFIEKGVLKGTATKPKEQILTEARKEAARRLTKNRSWVLGGEGAAYTGAFDLFDQSFEIDIEEAMEDPQKTEMDYLQTILMAGVGGLGGALLPVGGLAVKKLGNKKALRKLELDNEASRVRVPTQTSDLSVSAGSVGSRQLAHDAQKNLEDGGTLTINIAEGKKLNKKRKAELDNELKSEGFTETQEISPGVYETTKIHTLRDIQLDRPNVARTKTEKVLAKIKRGVYTNIFEDADTKAAKETGTFTPKEKATIARRRRDNARASAERSIKTNYERLTNAIKKDFEVKDLKPITRQQFRLINNALKGDSAARQELVDTAPTVLDEIDLMRENIKDLQQRLIDTEAIKEGSNLEAKILQSMGKGKKNKDGELYLTTSYEKYENPNWATDITTREGLKGGTVLEEAQEWLTTTFTNKDKVFKNVYDKFRRGEDLTPEEQVVYDKYLGTNGEVNETIQRLVTVNEDDLAQIFQKYGNFGSSPGKILKGKQDIPVEIRRIMGEIEDPFTNYANTYSKLYQTVEQATYEKDIAQLARAGLLEGITARTVRPAEMVEVGGRLPKRKDIQDPFDPDQIKNQLEGIYAYPELADAIINGNEIASTQMKPLQMYLALQGHTRAAKTVWSPTAIARNFLGAGWMSLGAGYLSPRALKEIPKVMKGLYRLNDEDLNKEIEKGISLGYLQSGTDIGAFRAALDDASDPSFWSFQNRALRDKKSLKDRAKKLNVDAVKFYQSMDDMWKQFAFVNESGNYRQVLIDKGINPDAVVRSFRSGDGKLIEITELDEFAANEVSKHMQNYAGVPQFVRRFRMLPAADFLAFTTEIIRTQKNIIKTALKDMKEGRELMRIEKDKIARGEAQASPDGYIKGQAQAKAGERRLGSIIAAQTAAPALAAAGYALTGVDEKAVDENGKELPYTVREGIEAFDQPWQKGSNFLYLGTPENGRARRINISYLNPWAKTQDPIRAGIRALTNDGDIDAGVDDAFKNSIWNPIKETFGPSMLFEAMVNMGWNTDPYGKKIFRDTDSGGEQFRKGVLTTWETFEPGAIKSIRDISTSLNAPKTVTRETLLGDVEVPVGFTRSGREKGFDEQILALSGVKPETIDIKETIGFKINDIKRLMGESGKTFQRAYQQRTPITSNELVEAYSEGLAKEYEYAKQMYDLVSKAKSLGLSNSQIINAVTDEGLFTNRLDRKFIYNLMNKGVFIPAPPKMSDIVKWGISTEKRTGTKPPLRDAQQEIMNVYKSYIGAPTGER